MFGGGLSISGSKTGLKDMRSDLRAVWARDTLGLSEGAYRELCFHISVSFRFLGITSGLSFSSSFIPSKLSSFEFGYPEQTIMTTLTTNQSRSENANSEEPRETMGGAALLSFHHGNPTPLSPNNPPHRRLALESGVATMEPLVHRGVRKRESEAGFGRCCCEICW